MSWLLDQTLNKSRNTLLAYIGITLAFTWMMVGLFPSFEESYDEILQSIPEGFADAFGAETGMAINLESFLSLEYFSLMWPIIMLIFAISYGSGALSGEIERGSIEVLLGQPVSRFSVFLSKYLAGFVQILVLTYFSIFSIIPFAEVYNVAYRWEHYISLFTLGFLFAITIFSFAMMVSSLASTKGRASFIVSGITIGMYALTIISSVNDAFESLKYGSIFFYFDASSALQHNEVSFEHLLLLIFVSLLSFAIGMWNFTKRDV